MAQDFSQSSTQFLASIDAEIARLQQLRSHIADVIGFGSAKASSKVKTTGGSGRRGGMSEEGRRKIAEAQKARWAKQRSPAKAVSNKAPGKKAAPKRAARKSLAKKAAAAKVASEA